MFWLVTVQWSIQVIVGYSSAYIYIQTYIFTSTLLENRKDNEMRKISIIDGKFLAKYSYLFIIRLALIITYRVAVYLMFRLSHIQIYIHSKIHFNKFPTYWRQHKLSFHFQFIWCIKLFTHSWTVLNCKLHLCLCVCVCARIWLGFVRTNTVTHGIQRVRGIFLSLRKYLMFALNEIFLRYH